MIINMVQTRSRFGADFVFSDKDNPELYTANVRLNTEKSYIDLIEHNKPALKLNSEIGQIASSWSQKEYNTLNILNPNDEICGKVYTKWVNKLFSGYKYYEINYGAELYTCYEIGRGKEGTFVCIYKENEQVAMIQKIPIVYDNKDCYTIYTVDSKYNKVICLFSLYYDHRTSGNYSEIVYRKKETHYYYTTNKELKAKYNPKFKELC